MVLLSTSQKQLKFYAIKTFIMHSQFLICHNFSISEDSTLRLTEKFECVQVDLLIWVLNPLYDHRKETIDISRKVLFKYQPLLPDKMP